MLEKDGDQFFEGEGFLAYDGRVILDFYLVVEVIVSGEEFEEGEGVFFDGLGQLLRRVLILGLDVLI